MIPIEVNLPKIVAARDYQEFERFQELLSSLLEAKPKIKIEEIPQEEDFSGFFFGLVYVGRRPGKKILAGMVQAAKEDLKLSED